MFTFCLRLPIVQCIAIIPLAVAPVAYAGLTPVGTAFTYQGQLRKSGVPVAGTCNFRFGLWRHPTETPGRLASAQINDVSVENGLFAVEVDFGVDVFRNEELWLEIEVECPEGPTLPLFTTLEPRQRITPSPYAHFALNTRGIVVNDEGNVGLGVPDPAHALEVTGTATEAVARIFPQRDDGQARLDLLGGPSGTEGAIFRYDGTANLLSLEGVTAGVASRLLTLTPETGQVGVGTGAPQARLHVVRTGLAMFSAALHGDEVIVEDSDAALALYSDDSGSAGSAISLKEINDKGGLEDHWAIWRRTSPVGSALRITYGTQAAPDANATMMTVTSSARLGVGTPSPTGTLAVRTEGSLIQGPVTHDDDIVVESTDAVLGLYSSGAGSAGSAISLKEIGAQGALTDHWGIYRRTSSFGAVLRFTYGPSVNYASNPTILEIRPTGEFRTVARTRSRVYTAPQFTFGGPARIAVAGNRPRVDFDRSVARSTAYLPIDLPDGATITAVSAFVEDSEEDHDIRMELWRHAFGNASATRLAMAETSKTPGQTLLEFPVNVTLDRSNFDYYLKFSRLQLKIPESGTAFLWVFEVDVSYTTNTLP